MTRARTTDPALAAECRCPTGYPIISFTAGEPVRVHHTNLCGLPDEPTRDRDGGQR